MDATKGPAAIDPSAYNPRLWEGLQSRINRYDDTNVGLQKRHNDYRGVPQAVMDGARHTYIRIGSFRDGWYEYYRDAKGHPYFHNPELEIPAKTCVRHKDILYRGLEWRCVFAVLRGRILPDADATDLYLDSSGETTCCYYMADRNVRPIRWRVASSLAIPDTRSKCLCFAYPFAGCRAHIKRIYSNEAYLWAAENEVEGGIVGNMPDYVTPDGSASPFSTTKGSEYSLERTGVSGSSACHPNRTTGTTRVPDTAGAQHYARHRPIAKILGPLVLNTPLLPTRPCLPGSPLDSSYETRVRTEHDACLDYAPVTPSPVADRVAVNASTSVDRTTGVGARQPVKKALVVGINYCHSTPPGVGRLRFAVNDARRVAQSLKGCGFSQDNLVLLTDQPRGQATYDAVIKNIRWLVGDAKAGDTLFFFYSGHGCNNHPQHGAGLLTEDNRIIPRRQLETSLVDPVPEGCELQLVIDSCFASSMIKLQYRVKQMAPNYDTVSSATMAAYPTVAAPNPPGFIPPTRVIPQSSIHVAFPGPRSTPGPANRAEPEPLRLATGPDLPACPKNVAAIPYYSTQTTTSQARVYPSPAMNAYQTVHPAMPPSMALSFPATPNEMFCGWHVPLKVNPVQDSFYRRPGGAKIAKPAGRVFFWAGTGEHQSAFESYNAPDVRDGIIIQNGIVANALCTALGELHTSHSEQCELTAVARQMLSLPASLFYGTNNIEEENVWRHVRDSKKSNTEKAKLIHASRVQLAELWVSQHEPLRTSVLDQPIFPS